MLFTLKQYFALQISMMNEGQLITIDKYFEWATLKHNAYNEIHSGNSLQIRIYYIRYNYIYRYPYKINFFWMYLSIYAKNDVHFRIIFFKNEYMHVYLMDGSSHWWHILLSAFSLKIVLLNTDVKFWDLWIRLLPNLQCTPGQIIESTYAHKHVMPTSK